MTKSLRVLVTGGAGFIGTNVVSELVARGHTTTVLDSLRPDVHTDGGEAARARLHEIAARSPAPDRAVNLAVGDARDLGVVTRLCGDVDVVVHLAAKVGLGLDIDDIDDYVSSNDLGTATVLRAAARAGITRFVQASSMVVYGEGHYTCDDHGVVPPAPRTRDWLEQGRFDPPCPVCAEPLTAGLVSEHALLDPRNTYAVTKVAQEQLASVWSRETGASAVSLRLHNVYGPNMPKNTPYAGVAAIFASALDRGEAPRVFEDGGQRRDFVHVTDIGAAFAVATEADTSGHRAFNVGSGVVHTVGDLAQALSGARGGPEPVVTGQFRLGDVRHVTASSERIADELGWRATVSLEDGVRALTFD
ncbi:NAD(P)-dependent oxidoreductase [Humibacillus sp. DSM 29435]|uniref:NAD-dependent epimerase/dehydratase family protein n=1 Tax=Humibacillus sp. DSM 29435 TaxID=1869167 RepID=UPI0020C7D633|nr:NAD-dependent epimerase/dehydratase family protein [Humibacillus sp. DSM 29435]